ncbi:MAG: FUSC family protein [Clostridia bacterium]|nr:FUSC family protein [Clostridia bacterium]
MQRRVLLSDRLPPLGQRIIKTSLAVFICLFVYYLRGYRGQAMPTEATITAIICLQPYARDTKDFALNRLAGTLIGAGLGLLFLFLLATFPALTRHTLFLYALMALGTMISLYAAVALRMPDTSSLAAIVFICVVIAFPDIESPLLQAFNRTLDVLLGNTVAILLNVIHLPRKKNRDLVFFIRSKDLGPDHYSEIPSTALFRLNYLYDDGARICVMSEHAPAFFMLQMRNTKVNTPLIVMDGAAIYDLAHEQYLSKILMPKETATALQSYLELEGIPYFVYTIHNNRMRIFHYGDPNDSERQILDHMKRSHYRYYLEDGEYDPSEVVYFKVVVDESKYPMILPEIEIKFSDHPLRFIRRRQVSAPNATGLYLYAREATMQNAENTLMELLRENNPSLKPVEIKLSEGYHNERDAVDLLHKIGRLYEPVSLPFLNKP